MDSQTRRFVRQRAAERCEYCQLHQRNSELPHHVEHIIARQHGGSDEIDNLALACHRCNLRKGPNLSGIDPGTGLGDSVSSAARLMDRSFSISTRIYRRDNSCRSRDGGSTRAERFAANRIKRGAFGARGSALNQVGLMSPEKAYCEPMPSGLLWRVSVRQTAIGAVEIGRWYSPRHSQLWTSHVKAWSL